MIPKLNDVARYKSLPVGTIKVVDGFKFERSKNGLWKLLPTKELKSYLKKFYVDQSMPLRKLAEVSGQPMATLQNLLNEFNLMRKKKPNSDEEVFDFCIKNKNLIVNLYHNEGLNVSGIVTKINSYGKIHVTRRQLSSYFDSIGLERRSHVESIHKYRDLGRGRTPERGEAVFSSHAVSSWHYHLDLDLDRLTYNQYKRVVYRFTYMAIARLPHLYPDLAHKRDRKRLGISGVDLDHQFSISNGYYDLVKGHYVKKKQVVPLEVMCHPCNLKLIPERTNCIKGSRNHKTLDQLLDEIKKFNKKHGDIFDDYYDKFTKDDVVELHRSKKLSKESLCLR